jgi:hypothetical protein
MLRSSFPDHNIPNLEQRSKAGLTLLVSPWIDQQLAEEDYMSEENYFAMEKIMTDIKQKLKLEVGEGENGFTLMAEIEAADFSTMRGSEGLALFRRIGSLDLELHRVEAFSILWRKMGGLPEKPASRIGAVERTGEHKGEIYGGIYPADGKPIWFSEAPKLMDHHAAAVWAKKQGGSLPTRQQGDYLTTLKDEGGAFLTRIFNRGDSFPAGYVWLAEPSTVFTKSFWLQRLSDGEQDYYGSRKSELPILSVRR